MKSKIIVSLLGGLFMVGGAFGAIGCGGGGDTEVTMVVGTNSSKYCSSKVTLPANAMAAAFDMDGDGTADNKLGQIISGLSAIMLNAQSGTDDAVTKGQLVLLMEEVSSDMSQQSAKDAGVKLSLAVPTAMGATAPKYDGHDTFTIDTQTSTAQFYGNISGGTFTSNNPATSKNPVVLTIALPLVPGQAPLLVPVTAGRLTFKRNADGSLSEGQLNGALRQMDIDTTVLPAVAQLITKQVQDPMASAAIKMFDINMDGTVTVDELKMSSLITNFLSPDIQLYQNGVYKPNPQKTMKDSLSIGLTFSGVAASFM
jgi:hypothetical protein